jgi:hypothetical protein
LRSLFTDRKPAELRGYLALPSEGKRAAAGSAVPLLGPQVFGRLEQGALYLPEGARLPGPADYAGVFLTLDNYIVLTFDGERVPSERIAAHLAGQHEPEVLIASLVVLNWVIRREGKLKELAEEFGELLDPDAQHRLHGALKSQFGEEAEPSWPAIPSWAAMRYVILSEPRKPAEGVPVGVVAVMLAHALASDLDKGWEETEKKILDRPAHLVLEVTRAGLMVHEGDAYGALDRTIRLWRNSASAWSGTRPVCHPPTSCWRRPT